MEYLTIKRMNRKIYLITYIMIIIILGFSLVLSFIILKFGLHAKKHELMVMLWICLPIYSLGLVPSVIWLTIARLRDANLSAIWILLLLIPIVNVIFFIITFLLPGTPSVNRYGLPTMEYYKKLGELLKQGYSKGIASRKIFSEINYFG